MRDPRDRLISALLFGLHGVEQDEFDRRMSLLKKKEQLKTHYSFIQLIQDIYPKLSLDQVRGFLISHIELLQSCIDQYSAGQIVHYEDLINHHTEELADYLGVDLSGPVIVPARHAYAKRSTKVAQWQDWFTFDDVSFLKPVFDAFMQQYGYMCDWKLNDMPEILPEHCSEFVLRARQQKQFFEAENIFWSD